MYPRVGVRWRISLMSSSLIYQQFPEYLANLTRVIYEVKGKWLHVYSSGISSKQQVASLSSSHLAFLPGISLEC